MEKGAKRAKMLRRNKENAKPLKLTRKSDEKTRRFKKYVVLTKRRHCNSKELTSIKPVLVKGRSKPVEQKCTFKKLKRVEKNVQPPVPNEVEEEEEKQRASPSEYLASMMHKSLHKIPLTRTELHHLFIKYKKDGHYRIEASLPSFLNNQDYSIKDNATLHTAQTQFSQNNYNYNTGHQYEYTSVKNTETPVYISNTDDTNTLTQGNNINESYRGSWHDPVGARYNNNFDPLYIDNENPYDLSNRTSSSSTSDSNTIFNASSFDSNCSPELSSGLESFPRNNTNDYGHLRNHDFIDSYIPPINPTFSNNIDCNVDNNVLATLNKDNGFIDKLYTVINQMWENPTQISPSTNIETYYNRKQSTNNTLYQDSTFAENHYGQNNVTSIDNNANYWPQVKTHFYIPSNNGTDENNYSNLQQ